MNIHILQHVNFETPGLINEWAKNRGHSIRKTNFKLENPLPDCGSSDMLIILGGPMSVHDEDKYPWLKPEKEFIETCIESNKKILGICLGAQLIADVLGAEVKNMASPEIGWHKIYNSIEKNDHLFDFIPDGHLCFHWHGEYFDIPVGASRILESEACRNQAFIFRNNVFAFQCHFEMNGDSINKIVEKTGSQLKKNKFVQNTEEILLLKNQITANRDILFRILDKIENL